MKKVKKLPAIVIMMLIVLSISVNVTLAKTNLLHFKHDSNHSAVYSSDEEINKMLNSEKAKLARENAKKLASKRLEDAWNDIKSTYNLDEEPYIKLYLENLPKEKLKEKSPIFSNGELCQAVFDIYSDYHTNIKPGDLAPVMLVKKDGSELLLGYKDKDYNNVLIRSNKNGDTWVKDRKVLKGKPILDIGESDKKRKELGLPSLH